MITIAVTGGAGMIGSNFIRHVNKHYPDVTIYLYDDLKNCSKRLNNIRDLKFEGAILPAENVLEKGQSFFDLVFHFAANSSTDCTAEDAQKDYLLTEFLAKHLYEKLVFASSAGVYGNPDDPHPLSWYALYKKRAEELVLQFRGTAFRFFNVFGPGEEHKPGQNSPFFRYTVSILKNEPILMYDQDERRDFVSTNLVCKHLDLCLIAKIQEAGKTKFKTNHHQEEQFGFDYAKRFDLKGNFFDVGTGMDISFSEVLDVVCTQMKVNRNDLKIEKRELNRPTQKFTKATKTHPDAGEHLNNPSIFYYCSYYHDHIKKMFDSGEIK